MKIKKREMRRRLDLPIVFVIIVPIVFIIIFWLPFVAIHTIHIPVK
ncbi:MAG: hypothetical protein ACFFDP_02055 [Promethearchaeota archaeon]